MKYRWLAVSIWLVALALALLVSVGALAATPQISTSADHQQFTVSFEKGAIWACTVYQSQRVTDEDRANFPDGKYAPRHCWALDETMTSYPDDWAWILPYDVDWHVWAEVGYPRGGEVVYVKTNVVVVHR